MTRAQEQRNPQPQPTQTGRTDDYPAWCDPTRCTVDPARQTDGYRSDLGGEHRSAPVPVRLTSAVLLPVRDGTAWLSEADVRASGRDDAAPSATVPADRPAVPAASAPRAPAPGGTGHPSGPAVPVDVRTVADLIPAARAARATLAETGLSLSRDHLADVMRDAGHGVSNERVSFLLKILKAEQEVTTIGAGTVAPPPRAPEPLSEVVA